jgi:hypothetical protein
MATDTPEMQAIVQRIEKLEAENRRLKRVGLAVAVLTAVVFGMAQTKPSQTVEAKEFILKDKLGRERAALRMDVGDSVRFGLKDARGDPLMSLEVDQSGPELSLWSPEGGLGVAMRAGADYGKLWLSYPASGLKRGAQPQLILNVSNIGPSVELADFNGDEGLERVRLGVLAKEPSITVSDAEGFETKIGSADLLTAQTGEAHRTSAASLVLFGKDNRVLWSAP